MHVHTLTSLSEGRDPAWRAGMEEVRLISLAGTVVVQQLRFMLMFLPSCWESLGWQVAMLHMHTLTHEMQ